MAQVLVTEDYLSDVGQALRTKLGTSETFTPAQMGNAIRRIPTGEPSVLVSKSIVANGTYDPADDDADGYNAVTVNVPNSYSAGDEGKVVDNGALVAQTSQNITQNGTYDTTLINEVDVDVAGGGGGTTNVLSGTTPPSSSQGENGAIYLEYLNAASGILSYVRTNNTVFDLVLSNWTYRTSDKVVFRFKNVGSHNDNWGVFLGVTPYSSTGALWMQYNLYSGRTALNIAHGGSWSGDGNYSFTGPSNTSLYYEIIINGSNIEIKSGAARGKYNDTQVSTSLGSASDVDTSSPTLFPTNGSSKLNVEFHELMVYRGENLIHHYCPIQGGIKDLVDSTTYTISSAGATYGSALEPLITEAHLKKSNAWQNLIGSNINDVNVGGGGSGVELLTRAAWDALTTAQKQAKGLVAIQDSNSGYLRGELVNGADYLPVGIYLPYSDETKIICSAHPGNYDVTANTWGDGTNPINFSAVGSTQNADGSVSIKTKTDGTLAYVDLGINGTPFTVYIVGKVTNANGTYTRELGVMASRSSGQGLLLYGTTINVSSWASDTSTGISALSYFVGVLQFAGSGNAQGCVIASSSATPSFISKQPSTAGRYITIGRTDIDPDTYNAEPSDMDILFLGVTTDVESQSVITQNMQYLAQELIERPIPTEHSKACHIYTNSTGGFDAAIYVQNGYWDDDNNQFIADGQPYSVLYTTVQESNTYNCNGIATLGYPSNWCVYATDAITDGTNNYSSGDQVKTWSYSSSVDFYIWESST